MLDNIIVSAESQGARNLQVAYSLKERLEELSNNIMNKKELNIHFIKNWNNIVAHASRFFEGHPILNLLNSVDKNISAEN